MALASLLCTAPAGADGEKAPELTTETLHALLEDAAATFRGPLSDAARRGALARQEDLGAYGTLPLTLAGFAIPWVELSRDLWCAPDLRLSEIVDLMALPPGAEGARVSILRKDALRDVTLEVQAQSARGTVEFQFGERMRGQVEWKAVVEGGAWRVQELTWPTLEEGVMRRGERWYYRHGPDLWPASAAAVQRQDLPVLGWLGSLKDRSLADPEGVLHLSVMRKGHVVGPEGLTGLEQVRARTRELDHLVKRAGKVVLRADAAAPWHVTGWTIDSLRPAEGAFTKLELYVTGRSDERPSRWQAPFEGEGFLTLGRLEPLAEGAPAPLVVSIEPDAGEVPAPSVYRAVAQQLGDAPRATRRVVLQVGGEGRVYAGHVFRIADLALRAGASDIDFVPLPMPAVPEGGLRDEGMAFAGEHAAAHPVAQEGFRLRIGTSELRGDPPVPRAVRTEFEPAGAVLR